MQTWFLTWLVFVYASFLFMHLLQPSSRKLTLTPEKKHKPFLLLDHTVHIQTVIGDFQNFVIFTQQKMRDNSMKKYDTQMIGVIRLLNVDTHFRLLPICYSQDSILGFRALI